MIGTSDNVGGKCDCLLEPGVEMQLCFAQATLWCEDSYFYQLMSCRAPSPKGSKFHIKIG